MPDSTTTQDLQQLDEATVSKLHWKIMLVSGMGFFTDAYDLFIIGVVMAMLKPMWHPSPVETGLVTSTALLASAIGAVLFGRVADLMGRKRIYGVEVLVLAAGAVACAFAPSMFWLILFRVILGLGIGGDYPVSATIMGEFAGKKSRGMLISLVFAMQAAGLIFGPLFAALLLAYHVPGELAWRIHWASAQSRRLPCIGPGAILTKRHDSRLPWKNENRRSSNRCAQRVISGAAMPALPVIGAGSFACWESASPGSCWTSRITEIR
jgi:MFS family permease